MLASVQPASVNQNNRDSEIQADSGKHGNALRMVLGDLRLSEVNALRDRFGTSMSYRNYPMTMKTVGILNHLAACGDFWTA
jgi:hypothetical protein